MAAHNSEPFFLCLGLNFFPGWLSMVVILELFSSPIHVLMHTFFWRPTLALTIGSLLLFLTSCDTGTITEDLQAESPFALSEEELNQMPYVEAALLLNPVLQEPTLDNEMAILIDGAPEQLPDQAFVFFDSTGQRYTIWSCLDSVNLSPSQMDSLTAGTRRFVGCKRFTIHEIRQINRTILAGANLQRATLRTAYQNGRITRIELNQQLRQLALQTRKELKNNPVKLRHLAQLRHCYHRYLRAIHGTLTPTQWTSFKDCFKHIRPR